MCHQPQRQSEALHGLKGEFMQDVYQDPTSH